MLDLDPAHLEVVRGLLARYVPDREVWAFGSRVNGKAKPFSDLDVAILGETALGTELIDLKEALSESELPFKVDIIDWAVTEPHFREIIAENFEVLVANREDLGSRTAPEIPPATMD